MAWTFTPTAIGPDAAQRINIRVTGRWTNSVTSEVIPDTFVANDLTAPRLAAQAQFRVQAIEARDAALATLAPLLNAPLVLPRDIPLTKEEQAAADAKAAADAFFLRYDEMNRLQLALEKGLIKSDDADLASAIADVKAGLAAHPEYQKDPRFK